MYIIIIIVIITVLLCIIIIIFTEQLILREIGNYGLYIYNLHVGRVRS